MSLISLVRLIISRKEDINKFKLRKTQYNKPNITMMIQKKIN